MPHRFASCSRVVLPLSLALVAVAGCQGKARPSQPQSLDYARELPPGEKALRKIPPEPGQLWQLPLSEQVVSSSSLILPFNPNRSAFIACGCFPDALWFDFLAVKVSCSSIRHPL